MIEVVALFDSNMEAERAIDRLESLGYDRGQVGVMHRQMDDGVAVDHGDVTIAAAKGPGTAADEGVKGVAGGAIGGAAVGVGASLLASAGLLLVPGAGPFLAAGTLAGTLGAAAAGAASGAAIGGVAGAIYGATTDDPDATFYREGVDRGGALVTVEVADGDQSGVAETLIDSGAKKVDFHGDAGWL
jgi:hypothetical protein